MSDADEFQNFVNSAATEAFVGPRWSTYKSKWERIYSKNGSLKGLTSSSGWKGSVKVTNAKSSWNWGALIFGPTWLLYRKMYLSAAVIFTLMTVPDVISVVLKTDFPPRLWIFFLILPNALIARYGDSQYLEHVFKWTRKFKAAGAGDAEIAVLARQTGGVSWLAAIGGSTIYAVLYVGLLLGLGVVYPDEAAKASTASNHPVVAERHMTPTVPVSTAPTQGPEWRKFAGAGAYDLMADTAVKATLKPILGDSYDDFELGLSVGDDVELLDNRYLLAMGCAPHLCTVQGSLLVVNVDSGELFSVIASAGKLKVLSGQTMLTPKDVQARMKKWVSGFQAPQTGGSDSNLASTKDPNDAGAPSAKTQDDTAEEGFDCTKPSGIGGAIASAAGDGCGDPDIVAVRDGTMADYDATTVGAAFDASFSKPRWKAFVGDKGQHVVEFHGRISKKLHADFVDTAFAERFQSRQAAQATLVSLEAATLSDADLKSQVPGILARLNERFHCHASTLLSSATDCPGDEALGQFLEGATQAVAEPLWPAGAPVRVQWVILKNGENFRLQAMLSDAWRGQKYPDILEVIFH